jgi:hypothetical protein
MIFHEYQDIQPSFSFFWQDAIPRRFTSSARPLSARETVETAATWSTTLRQRDQVLLVVDDLMARDRVLGDPNAATNC